jgi:hypothetical protein
MNQAGKAAANHYLVRHYASLKASVFSEHKSYAMHVAVNLTKEM